MNINETRRLRDMLSIILAALKDKGINKAHIKVDTSFDKILIEINLKEE